MTATAVDLVTSADPIAPEPVRGARGPSQKLTACAIVEQAVRIVDADGADALTVRRLATELGISTRTLYKRIGSRHRLVVSVVDAYVLSLGRGIRDDESWQESIVAWCAALHRDLITRPKLTALLSTRDVVHRIDQGEAIKSMVRQGYPLFDATWLCGLLIEVAVSGAIAASARPITGDVGMPAGGHRSDAKRMEVVLSLIVNGNAGPDERTASPPPSVGGEHVRV